MKLKSSMVIRENYPCFKMIWIYSQCSFAPEYRMDNIITNSLDFHNTKTTNDVTDNA